MKRSTMSATAAIEQRISGQIGQPASCTILSKSTPSTCESARGARADYGLRSRAEIPPFDARAAKILQHDVSARAGGIVSRKAGLGGSDGRLSTIHTICGKLCG
jgi:hypothetical protein